MVDAIRIAWVWLRRLPRPWQRHWSAEWQLPYYWNPVTEESVWEAPLEDVEVPYVQYFDPYTGEWF